MISSPHYWGYRPRNHPDKTKELKGEIKESSVQNNKQKNKR